MKQIGIIIFTVVLFSCQSASKKEPFNYKIDTTKVVYKDSVRGPFILEAVYQPSRYFVPIGDSGVTTTGKWIIDTAWAVKVQTDTLTGPKAQHTYQYQIVNKKYVQQIKK